MIPQIPLAGPSRPTASLPQNGSDNPEFEQLQSANIHTNEPGTAHSADSDSNEDDEVEPHGAEPGRAGQGAVRWRKRRREIGRGKRACLPCRTRKCKCGGDPPGPCPVCLEDEIACSWPAEDGRSSQARKRRSKSKRAAEAISLQQQQEASSWVMDSNWMDLMTVERQDSGVEAEAGPSNYFRSPNQQQSRDYTTGLADLGQSVTGSTTFVPGFQLSQTPFPQNLSLLDPASLILAMTSRLPTIESGSQPDQTSPTTDFLSAFANSAGIVPSEQSLIQNGSIGDAKKMVKVTWWRPHGQTAIAPGLKRITLKVRVESASPASTTGPARSGALDTTDIPEELVSPDKGPNVPIMRHLLGVFMDHFGCQFPFVEQESLESELVAGNGSVFLLDCIAAVASRFSTHQAIALPNLRQHEYGSEFGKAAKGLLGSMLSVPSRDTVLALALLAHLGLGTDSESDEWMMTGMAVRMAIDLGLHLDPGKESNISPNERRLNRLVFWSVILLDFALAFGVGRPTTFRIEDVTQSLPTQEDIWPDGIPSGKPQSPFPFAAKQMRTYGPLINLLNGSREHTPEWQREFQAAWTESVEEYHSLPEDMRWSVSNMQNQSSVKQGPIFLHLHLWMHTIIASGYLTGTDYLRRPSGVTSTGGFRSGAVTPNALAASNLWRHSARTIGDILVLSNVINPFVYLSLPFVNQAFFVAGCCYIKEIEQYDAGIDSPSTTRTTAAEPPEESSDQAPLDDRATKKGDLSRALLKSVASSNISTLQQGLANQATYWSGIAWVAETLVQRLSGIQATAIDLVSVTEKLASSVSVPDAGLLHRSARLREGQPIPQEGPQSSSVLDVDIADLDFLSSLSFAFQGGPRA